MRRMKAIPNVGSLVRILAFLVNCRFFPPSPLPTHAHHSYCMHLFVRNALNLVSCSFNPVLRSEDLDHIRWAVDVGDVDLRCGQILKLLQLGSSFAEDEPVVVLWNAHLNMGLQGRDVRLVSKKFLGTTVEPGRTMN